MSDMIEVKIDNKYTSLYKKGTKLIDIAKDFQNSYKYDILGAIINNDLKELRVFDSYIVRKALKLLK